MNKDIIEFPYNTKKETIRTDKSIDDFKIHYYYSEGYLEKEVYRCYSNKRGNSNAIGYIFSVERLHSNNIELENESNQKYFEAYMDAAREVFFNSEKYVIEKYFSYLDLNEEFDKVRIDEILKFKSYLNFNRGNFIGIENFEEFKRDRDFPLIIFIEDTRDAEKNRFNSEHMKILMMLERHFFAINDTNEFYASQKHLELKNDNIVEENDNIVEEDENFENDLQHIIIKSISNDIDSEDLIFMTEVLPEFYYQSYNTEYVKFSVLYQYIEIFISCLAHKMLDNVLREKDDKNLVDLKSEINTILTEKHRIQKLFTVYSSGLSNRDKDSFYDIYRKILTGIDLFDESEESQDDTQDKNEGKKRQTYNQLYRLRNILYHNLRAFKNKEVVDQNLKSLNLEFEKIIAKILTTFSVNSNENVNSNET